MAASGCLSNCTRPGIFEHEWTADELWAPWNVLADYFEYQPWFFSLLGSAMVGLSGVFPLLVIPIDEAADLKHGDSAKTLKILLSFAVGGLLGDVFLHLLPEAWENHAAANTAKGSGVNHASMGCGLWVLAGFLVFVVAEKMFSGVGNPDDEDDNAEEMGRENEAVATIVPKKTNELENNNCDGQLGDCPKLGNNGFANGDVTKINGLKNGLRKVNGIDYKKFNGYANGFAKINGVKNGFCADAREKRTCLESFFIRNSILLASVLLDFADQQLSEKSSSEEKRTRERPKPKHVIGYLNLVANCVDNFTHGLAVGGSFLVSFRLGALTTFAILIHEIPHEIGDFAILLKSGFNRWDAAKAQLMTATGGMCGAFVAVVFSGDAVESRTSWILPFTAGGFLHIGLVTVLPELLKETDPWESLKQIGALLSGISVMAFLTIMCD
ncbi:hypothetical protein TSAR_008387 [Trichomalopsis sarcophagae]|uniref:Zinc transporter ZIP13 homolog n=1 Tax=Trichomalopsis sarcophagae TaxID=543379 RepID=A0A232F907_9HYME|nr:hypothetical protein TSAR_008387 [Trichomalopsis sarcophagae]